MTASETIEGLKHQNDFPQKTVESLNQNIENPTGKIADFEEKLHKDFLSSSKSPFRKIRANSYRKSMKMPGAGHLTTGRKSGGTSYFHWRNRLT